MLYFQYQPLLSDINAANHVDNVRIYDWLNQQRMALFDVLGFDDKNHYFPANATITVDFMGELFSESPVLIKSSVKKIGSKSFTIFQTIEQDGKICVRCESVQVNFNVYEKKTAVLPEQILEAMTTQYMTDG